MSAKERPIILKAHEVCGILEGRQSQLRRICKPQPIDISGRGNRIYRDEDYKKSWGEPGTGFNECPFGQPGDRLWGRETFWCQNDTDSDGYQTFDCGSMLELGDEYASIDYFTNGDCRRSPALTGNEKIKPWDGQPCPGYWWLSPPEDWNGNDDYYGRGTWIFLPWEYFTKHSSAQMPRWASRILLEIVSVRVERLQDISRGDCMGEGCPFPNIAKETDPKGWYKGLWEKVNGPVSWEMDPWVWVVEFKRVK